MGGGRILTLDISYTTALGINFHLTRVKLELPCCYFWPKRYAKSVPFILVRFLIPQKRRSQPRSELEVRPLSHVNTNRQSEHTVYSLGHPRIDI